MNIKDKEIFIEDLISSVKNEILSKVDNMPEEWDGIELRQYISDCFKEVVFKDTLKGKRKKEYINTVIVNNL